jgi:hypothetical protein
MTAGNIPYSIYGWVVRLTKYYYFLLLTYLAVLFGCYIFIEIPIWLLHIGHLTKPSALCRCAGVHAQILHAVTASSTLISRPRLHTGHLTVIVSGIRVSVSINALHFHIFTNRRMPYIKKAVSFG